MKQEWSKSWRRSVQPRKQRKYVYNAPLHIARSFMATPLSKELVKKHSINNIIVRKGDKVKVLRGQFKGKTGGVEAVKIKDGRIAVEGVTFTGRDGKKKSYLIHPSKVVIIELNLEDKKRKASIERSNKSVTKKVKSVEVKKETKTAKETKGVKQ